MPAPMSGTWLSWLSQPEMFRFRRQSPEQTAVDPLEARFDVRPPPRGLKKLLGVVPGASSPFARTQLASGVNLYSANEGAKTLLVGFGGRHANLFMPVFMVLEALDSTQFDLLLLSDFKQLHFDQGIEGYAASMPQLMDKVGNLAMQRGYSASITYGCSMGGLPALRGCALLGADRTISSGCRFVWHPSRIKSGNEPISAFDLICHCRSPLPARSYLLYSEDNTEDVQAAAKLTAISPPIAKIEFPGNLHNFTYHIRKKGRLANYYSQIFDLNKELDPEKLRALME
jgi:hypothetical protein